MNVFDRRPLSLILCILLGGFLLFSVSTLDVSIAVIAVIVTLFLISVAIPSINVIPHFKALVAALLVSAVISGMYFGYVFYPTDKFKDEVLISGTVIDEESESYMQLLSVQTEEIDKLDARYKIYVYNYGEERIQPGSEINLVAELKEFRYENGFDYKTYYTSKGISAYCVAEKIDVLSVGETPLSYKFKITRQAICDRATTYLGEYSGGLLCAVLLGEREHMDSVTRHNFSRIGISHILALSGLHVSILVLGFAGILSLFGAGKKTKTVFGSIFVIAFMALTGFPPSVTRAGLMLLISSILYLASGCRDNITSLSIAFFIIVLLEPYSILDMGLWLSVLATFGILVYNEYSEFEYSEDGFLKRAFKGIFVGILISVFAVVATLGVCVVSFGTLSPISPFTTLIFSFLIEIFIFGGIFTLLLGAFLPIGSLVGELGLFIGELAENISKLPFVCVSGNHVIVKSFAIIISILFFAFAILHINKKKLYAVIVVFMFIITSGVAAGIGYYSQNVEEITYSSEGGDMFLITDGIVLLVDASEHDENSSSAVQDLISSNNLTQIDAYFPINYNYKLITNTEQMLTYNKVSRVVLPLPQNDKEAEIAIIIGDTVSTFGAELDFYSDTDTYKFFDFEILITERAPFGNGDFKGSCIFRYKERLFAYVSSGAFNKYSDSGEFLYAADTVIFGKYGKKYSDEVIIDEWGDKLNSFVVCSENLFIDTKSDSYNKQINISYNESRKLLETRDIFAQIQNFFVSGGKNQ